MTEESLDKILYPVVVIVILCAVIVMVTACLPENYGKSHQEQLMNSEFGAVYAVVEGLECRQCVMNCGECEDCKACKGTGGNCKVKCFHCISKEE